MTKNVKRYLVGILLCTSPVAAGGEARHDVVVYGGTSGGVAAAVQAARMGKTVVIVEPGAHLGGLTAGGLGATDIGNKHVIGGLSREFYQRVWRHYQDDSAWKHEKRESYRSGRQSRSEESMWTFEPRVAERIFREMLRQANVRVAFEERLRLEGGVRKEGARITALHCESGRVFEGAMFVDATYEGDLMAGAGVRYTVGREANATYGETLNGVQARRAIHHQFIKPVDPYIVPGDPASGLLPGIHAGGPGLEGSGDRRVQAYNYRLCATDVPANRRPWPKPADHDPLRYELLLRNFEAGDHRVPWSPTLMPNRKTDANNNFAFSTDNIGMNYDYPEGDYATRERIVREHESYQKGLMWTLANHERVPESVRKVFRTWGLARDEFVDNDNWPHQLYVREARRLVGEYVMTEHHCRGTQHVDDSIGMGAYNMDSHHVQRYVDENGHARNEGDVQVGSRPYPISYRSVLPRAAECVNLLVPVCLSASHIAYGSIRMEPVFMVLGQSSATAACLAIDHAVGLQDLDYGKLRERLLADRQVLEWHGAGAGILVDRRKLPGIVVDDTAATTSGAWTSSSSVRPYVDSGYRHDGNAGKGDATARFELAVDRSATYELRLSYTPHPNRAGNVPVTVHHAAGKRVAVVDQRRRPPIDGLWISLGKFGFEAPGPAVVVVGNAGTDGYVIIDAVQLLPVK